MGILWANHQAGGFTNIPIDSSQEEFAEAILQWITKFQSAFLVEDRSDSFREKRGPVGIIVVSTDLTGDVIRPFGVAFEWATGRNILRSICSFLQFVKYSKDVSVCVIYGTSEEEPLFRRQRRYGHRLWHIGKGIWCLAGRKNNPRK